ncbi:TPA: hypothetical protein GXZ34_04935 [bacterium]|nr:hypothetical protein [bacterium]
MSYLDGRRSVFPEGGYDQILELFSLPASQRNNMKRYQELKLKENLSTNEQDELNSLTITLQHYIISEERMNLFGDILINMQKFFTENVEPYIENKKLEFQAEVDKMTYRGDWQPNTQYFKKNVVTSGGNGYIAKSDNLNQSPPNATYWGQISRKGDKGDPSLNINFKGAYEPSMPYVLGDAVTFGGLWYYAKQNTIGNPPTDATYWEIQTNQTLVSDTQPFDSRITGWVDTSL